MKKIATLLAVLGLMTAANAQFVIGLQGGYYNQKSTTTANTDYTKTSTWLGGLQLGYQITPKLYVGVMGGMLGQTDVSYDALDSMIFEGMQRPIENHQFTYTRSGWTVSPIVRYEVLKYGNMHFNLTLQGNLRNLGYTTVKEQYNTPFRNNGELRDIDPYEDSTSYSSWSISLRPTLIYEFSEHLNAELSLDFLSIGYISESTTYDNVIIDDESYKTTVNTLYAGLNTMSDAFRWESPMLRLGFNYTF